MGKLEQIAAAGHVATHIFPHTGHIGKEQRGPLAGQRAATLWLTGLSGAGKSTLAYALERRLLAAGRLSCVLDGDNMRHHLNGDLGFSPRDRQENIRRGAVVARLMNDAGMMVICAFISPLRSDRDMARQIMAVPMMFLNGQHFGQGRTNVEEILAKLDTNAGARQAEALSKKDVFDVLIVGGGPAGAAAAIYAARKCIKTGVLAERFGGQTLDTMAIENFISVKETDGPKFAMALEQHVKTYDVDIMNTQRASKLTPGKLIEIETANGAILKAKTVILATGARWREINVPGEKEYRNHGVAYCPHCDGPLFKGKRVAVIGGGNSGVEAAIDLAGLVKHVTLIEFGAELRADAVLQRKLHSLPNVTVITSAQTTEIHGDGKIVNGLSYTDRVSGESKKVELEGVFVQIGLVPNTEWLKGTVALSRHGEIEVDARGQTSIPGVFAAGDVTTVPYKQIIIATGEGAKAALSAFDHLIRSDDEEVVEESASKEALTA